MKQGSLVAFLTTTAIASAVPASAQPALFREVLGNGLTVVIEENRANPVVAIQVWVKVGAADESPAEAGIAHVFEHMLFKGTARRAVGEIARTVEAAGGEINAHTSHDQTVYEMTLPSDLLELGLDIMADAVFSSSFEATEVEREKEVIIEEFKRGRDNPGRSAMEGLFAKAFTTHTYGRPVIGLEQTIRDLKRETLLDFLHRWYKPGNMALVIVGDVDAADAVARVKRLFGSVTGNAGRPPRPVEPPQEAFRFVSAEQESNQVYLNIGFPIPGVRDPLAHRYDLLAQVLGGGQGSRLFRRLKLEKPLVNSIAASAYTPVDPGLFIVGISMDPGVLPAEVLGAVFEELSRSGEGIPREELDRAVVNIESDFVYQLQTVAGEAGSLGFFETSVGELKARESYLDLVRGTTREDVSRLAQTLFVPERMSVSVVSPQGKTAITGEELLAIARRALGDSPGAATGAVGDQVAGEVASRTLSNGLRVLVRRRTGTPVVSFRLALLGGLRYDPPGKEGLSNLCAINWSRGSAGWDRKAIVSLMDETASSLDPFSGNNSLGLTLTTLSRFRDRTLPLLLDLITAPTFPRDEFDKTRTEVLRRIRARRDDLAGSTIELLARTLFTGHPYRSPSTGTEASVGAVTPEDVGAFYRRTARPGSMVLSVVGDIDPEGLFAELEKGLGGWNPGLPEIPTVAPEPVMGDSRKAEDRREGLMQAHLAIGYPGCAIGDPDRHAWEVLNAVLTGQGGRLFTELRDRQSLAYAVSSFVVLGIDPGYLGIYIGLSPEKVPEAERGIAAQIAAIAAEPVAAEELERAKRYLIGQRVIDGQSYAAMASELAFAELYGLGLDDALGYPEKIRRVSAEDLLRVAKRFLAPGRHATAVILPK
jgi:zinc protease